MKNIHIIPTDKSSRLHITFKAPDNYDPHNKFLNVDRPKWILYDKPKGSGKRIFAKHIYITNDEKPKQGDWVFDTFRNACPIIRQLKTEEEVIEVQKTERKIILAADPKLIKDGVQAIDDNFLEWFVKNPSCERVEVKELLSNNGNAFYGYGIIIPKEEPTLANRRCTCMSFEPNCFTGSCRKCGFLPQEELKQYFECKCTNILQAENCVKNCGHGLEEEPKQEPGKETADYIDRHIVEALVEVAKQEIIEEGISDYDITSNIRYGDNVGERIKIKATIKSIKSNKEAFEEATENWLDKYSEKFDIIKSSQLPFCFNNRNELNELIEEVSKWQQEQDRNKLRELAKFRNELYEQLPTGKVNAFNLIKIINNHINRLDELI